MPDKILVTGGAGYIGSHACKALALAGYEPVTYDNLSIGNRWAVRWGPLEIGDIGDVPRLLEVFRRHRPIGVLHFAALALVGESVTEPALYYRQNVAAALGVMDAARHADVGAFVFSSTCAVYGVPHAVPIAETAPTAPINAYGQSKLMAERILKDFDSAYGFPHAVLRYFNAAGADPDTEIGECRAVETHLVPLAIEAQLGRRPPLRILGTDYPTADGTAVRDYVHVTDLAKLHVVALERLLNGTASFTSNIGTGTGISVRQMTEEIGRLGGHPVPTEASPRRPGDPAELVADASQSAQVFGPDSLPNSSLERIIETARAWHLTDRFAQSVAPRSAI